MSFRSIFKVVASIICLVAALAFLSGPIGGASLSTRRAYPGTQLTQGLVVVPATPTDLAATDAIIFQIVVANVTASAATITVSDKAGSPLALLNTVTIAPYTTYVVAFPEGVWMTSGITWTGGTASALNAEVFGFKK